MRPRWRERDFLSLSLLSSLVSLQFNIKTKGSEFVRPLWASSGKLIKFDRSIWVSKEQSIDRPEYRASFKFIAWRLSKPHPEPRSSLSIFGFCFSFAPPFIHFILVWIEKQIEPESFNSLVLFFCFSFFWLFLSHSLAISHSRLLACQLTLGPQNKRLIWPPNLVESFAQSRMNMRTNKFGSIYTLWWGLMFMPAPS